MTWLIECLQLRKIDSDLFHSILQTRLSVAIALHADVTGLPLLLIQRSDGKTTANKPGMTATAPAGWLQTRQLTMPNFNVIAYITSLRDRT